MKEGHPRAADPGPRRLVDEAHAGGGARVQRGLHRLDAVGDVVESRPPAAQELAHRGVGPERLEQLDVAVADVEQRRVDALLGHRLAVDEWHAELVAVERERVVDALDGDADVVDRGQHGAAEHIDPRLLRAGRRLGRLGGRGGEAEVDAGAAVGRRRPASRP